MTNEEYINQIVEIGNTLQIQPYSPKGQTLKKCIELLSAVPKREKGEWEVKPSNKEQGERDFIWWKCSKCGQVIYSETEKDRKEFHAFCGRCGADMRGDKAE